MRKFLLSLLTVALLAPIAGHSQYHHELGISLGGSRYFGELTKGKSFGDHLHQGVGVFFRGTVSEMFTVRTHLNYNKLSGSDADTDLEQTRGLDFETNLYELGAVLEWNILGFGFYGRRYDSHFSPYIYAGIAGFSFKPVTKTYQNGGGGTIELQPLGTEGQGTSVFPDRKPYGLTQAAIPLGGGIKVALNEQFNFGIDMGYRFALTDYIDDVSQTYVDNNTLIDENGVLAANLSNRSVDDSTIDPENPTSEGLPFNYGNDDPRGEQGNDGYFYGAVTFSLNVGAGTFSNGRSRGKNGAGCPGSRF